MSAAMSRVRTSRALLLLSAFAAALLWGLASALTVVVGWVAVDLLFDVPVHLRALAAPAAVAALAGAGALALWRWRRVLSLSAVALWIEERVPGLQYALVTAVELRDTAPGALERTVRAFQWDAVVARASALTVVRPLIPLVLAFATLALLPTGAVSRITTPAAGDALLRPQLAATEDHSLLSPLVATVQPPAYARQPERTVDEPVTLEALPGARIALRGRGNAERVSADVDGRTVRAYAERNRWRIDLTVPARATAITLQDGAHRRLLTIEPLVDEPPTVMLDDPGRDTVMRVARGSLPLAARVREDYGIARSAFEFIISSGSGELFRFRSGTLGAATGAGAREINMRASLSLDSLALSPGDVVHLRAVAWDANDVSGPGLGTSETRTIRIARSGEYDTVAVEGAPPPDLDADAVSQRMLIILTERLEGQRRRITRDSLVSASRALAQRQNVLRRRVAEVVFMRLGMQPESEHSHGPGDGHDHSDDELSGFLTPDRLLEAAGAVISSQGAAAMTGHAHDENPILGINQPLLEAYNHMWEASGELEIGEPARALPSMRRALEALQKAREAERYYVRGRSPRVVVDIARVRLASPQSVTPAARAAGSQSPSPRALLSVRLASAVELLASAPPAAMDSLLLVRLDALQHAPEAAPDLASAVQALRTGRDATDALVRARRAVDGVVRSSAGEPQWRGGW